VKKFSPIVLAGFLAALVVATLKREKEVSDPEPDWHPVNPS